MSKTHVFLSYCRDNPAEAARLRARHSGCLFVNRIGTIDFAWAEMRPRVVPEVVRLQVR